MTSTKSIKQRSTCPNKLNSNAISKISSASSTISAPNPSLSLQRLLDGPLDSSLSAKAYKTLCVGLYERNRAQRLQALSIELLGTLQIRIQYNQLTRQSVLNDLRTLARIQRTTSCPNERIQIQLQVKRILRQTQHLFQP